MIVAEDLTKVYPGKHAIEKVSFTVRQGETVGFLGPNGAGKTTTMRILTCFQPATEGTARIAGFDVFEQADEVKRNIGYLPESPPVYSEMRVREYLEFVAKIKGMPRTRIRARMEDTVERCGLGDVQHRLTGKLSKGYRQRVGLAQAILHNPPILILDEPTSGLDPKQVVEVRRLIDDLSGSHTIILSTHILPEVSVSCERVVIINNGRIVLSQSLKDLASRNADRQVLLLELKADRDVAEDLQRIDGVVKARQRGRNASRQYEVEVGAEEDIRARLAGYVVGQGWELLELRRRETSLEETYLRVVSSDGGGV